MQPTPLRPMPVRNTRLRLLEAAAQRVHDRGFYRTTLDEIASDVSIAKATFYHHFKNKEQLGEALIEYNIDRFIEFLDDEIFTDNRSGLARLERMCSWTLDQFAGGLLSKGCPVCNMVTELALEAPKYRQQLFRYFEACHQFIETALQDAKRDGDVSFDVPAADLAKILVGQLSGQLLVAKAAIGADGGKEQGVEIMRNGFNTFFTLIGGRVRLG